MAVGVSTSTAAGTGQGGKRHRRSRRRRNRGRRSECQEWGKGPGPSDGVPEATAVEGEEEEEDNAEAAAAAEEEKWLRDYSSMHTILIVGDGDFSFSLALASKFGSGAFMVATSLDTYESNTKKLKILETTVLHGIDVKRMKFHTDLINRRFDRIVFNFPHPGFKGKEDGMRMINLHKKLLRDFFSNARHLLMPYEEIHVQTQERRAIRKMGS